jgi:hypothetical protein
VERHRGGHVQDRTLTGDDDGRVLDVEDDPSERSEMLSSIRLFWDTTAPHTYEMFSQGEIVAIYLPARRAIRRQVVPGPSKLEWRDHTELDPRREISANLLQFLVNKRTEMAYAAAEGDQATASHIEEWFKKFEGQIRRLMEDDGLKLEFDRRAFNFRFHRSDGYTFDINTLADGHAAMLALLGELFIRVDAVQQARGDLTFEPQGVVVVDEIETHLHLSLQEQILPFLTEFFPRFQFIVATHSPAVIASIPGAVVYDLGKKHQTLSDSYRGVPYGALMTDHFGISSEIDLDSTEKLLRLRALASKASRTPEEERALADLSALLSARSQALAVEVWMVKERLGESNIRLAGGVDD